LLNIYLDTNVHSQLSNGLYPEELAEIKRLKLESKITVYFTGANLLELACMIRDEGKFFECREILRFSSRLCSNNILEDNWGHMQRSVANFLEVDLPVTIDPLYWVTTASLISNADNLGQVRKETSFLREYVRGFKKDWFEGACRTIDRIRGLLNPEAAPGGQEVIPESLIDESLLDEVRRQLWDETRRQLWEACKGHHRLPDYANQIDYETAYSKIPTVRYFIDIQRTYYERMIEEGTKPEEADYFDLEYVIYLDLMDYFVTNDNGLHDLYSRASREICQGCILLKDVCKLELLAPRAPFRDRLGKTRYEIRKK
jgi:hypothetical protein